jgi:hypothetical protein
MDEKEESMNNPHRNTSPSQQVGRSSFPLSFVSQQRMNRIGVSAQVDIAYINVCSTCDDGDDRAASFAVSLRVAPRLLLYLPDEVHDDGPLEDIRALGTDITMLHNDLISYHREESEAVPHNTITTYRRVGKTALEAIDLVGAHIKRKTWLLERAIQKISAQKSPW